jgi:hypothetical protein
MKIPSRPHLLRALAAVAIAVAVAGPFGSTGATAAPRPKPPTFTLSGTGTWQTREWVNDAAVNGTGQLTYRDGRTVDVQVAAVVQTDDRTLPDPGECEDAFATMTAYGARRVDFTMVGSGEVCGTEVQPPTSIVTHVFTGDFEVYGDHTTPRRLEGTDGFYEIRLANDGTASVFATDT